MESLNELPKCLLSPKNNRDYCIKELVDSERNYINSLNILSKYFMRPLKQLMRPKDHEIVFFKIEILVQLHTRLYLDLFQSVEQTSLENTCISEVFFNWSGTFSIYGDYCANLDKAQYLLTDLLEKSTYLADITQQYEDQANMDGKYKLTSLIVIPMQRILKYHLLLKEIIELTPKSHPDYHSIVKVYEIMIDLNSYINEIKRDSEMLDKITIIQNNITNLMLANNTMLCDYGRLLKDGEIEVKCPNDKNIKTRYIFLFDKLIVMCRTKKGTYISKKILTLSDFKLEVNASLTMKSQYNKVESHFFSLINSSENQVYKFFTKTEELKNQWVQVIESALDNINPQYCRLKLTNHHFTLKTFDKGSFCDHCGLWLKGLYSQGYKCVYCDANIHKSCIPLIRSCNLHSSSPKFSPQTILKKQNLIDLFIDKFVSRQSCNLKQIENNDWYAHTIKQQTAERILSKMPCGAFLIRIDLKQQGTYVISIQYNQMVRHMHISETEKNLFYLSKSKKFSNINDLVDYYNKNSLVSLKITLKYPYRKFLKFANI